MDRTNPIQAIYGRVFQLELRRGPAAGVPDNTTPASHEEYEMKLRVKTIELDELRCTIADLLIENDDLRHEQKRLAQAYDAVRHRLDIADSVIALGRNFVTQMSRSVESPIPHALAEAIEFYDADVHNQPPRV